MREQTGGADWRLGVERETVGVVQPLSRRSDGAAAVCFVDATTKGSLGACHYTGSITQPCIADSSTYIVRVTCP